MSPLGLSSSTIALFTAAAAFTTTAAYFTFVSSVGNSSNSLIGKITPNHSLEGVNPKNLGVASLLPVKPGHRRGREFGHRVLKEPHFFMMPQKKIF